MKLHCLALQCLPLAVPDCQCARQCIITVIVTHSFLNQAPTACFSTRTRIIGHCVQVTLPDSASGSGAARHWHTHWQPWPTGSASGTDCNCHTLPVAVPVPVPVPDCHKRLFHHRFGVGGGTAFGYSESFSLNAPRVLELLQSSLVRTKGA